MNNLNDNNPVHPFKNKWMEYADVTKLLLDTLLQSKKKYVSSYHYDDVWGAMRRLFVNVNIIYVSYFDTVEKRNEELGNQTALHLASLALLCDIDIKERAKHLCEIFPPLKQYLIDTMIFVPDHWRRTQHSLTYLPPDKNS